VIGQGPADFEAAEEMADTEYMLAILDNLHIYRFRVQGFRVQGFRGSGVKVQGSGVQSATSHSVAFLSSYETTHS
jgi:hypothetical protein